MRDRVSSMVGALAVAVSLATTTVVTLAEQKAATASSTRSTANWTAPRTADGRPDLQGVWANNNATPLERPKQWAGRQFVTAQELAAVKKVADEIVANDGDAQFGDGLLLAALEQITKPGSYDPATGNYNQFWLVERDFEDLRTSLVTDPPDGKIPALTPEGEKRRAARIEYTKLHPADGPEDRPAGERCVNFGVPKLGAGYNSYYQVFQTPAHVAILSEMAHDTRMIPLDGRPHVNKAIRQWNGDARGRWEGDTLVVETRNFSPKSEFRESTDQLQLVERFTRVGPETLNYEVTITDPTTWTKPWTVMIPLRKRHEAIYEYACHEGNEGMFGILAGHRAQERAEGAGSGERR
jgi:hypothetical protein